GEFVALCAGREDDDFFRRESVDVFNLYDRIIAVFDKTKFARYFDVRSHRAAVDDYFLGVFLGELNDADEAFKVRGEHRNDKAAMRFFDYFFERRVDVDLGDGPSWLPDVGRVHEEGKYVALLENGERALFFVGRFAVFVVELDIAGKDDVAVLG